MRLTDEASNTHVLPAFLTPNGGLNSGFMIVQYTAAALATENKVLSHPASVDTILTSANVEDHVSMGCTAALKARAILDSEAGHWCSCPPGARDRRGVPRGARVGAIYRGRHGTVSLHGSRVPCGRGWQPRRRCQWRHARSRQPIITLSPALSSCPGALWRGALQEGWRKSVCAAYQFRGDGDAQLDDPGGSPTEDELMRTSMRSQCLVYFTGDICDIHTQYV